MKRQDLQAALQCLHPFVQFSAKNRESVIHISTFMDG